jgi:putative membrane protein
MQRTKENVMQALVLAAALVTLTTLPAAAQIGNSAGAAPATPQQAPGQPAPHYPNTQDRLFIQLAGSGGTAEENGARQAEKKAHDAAVKDFARRLAQDHAKSNQQLASLAKAANVPLPENVGSDYVAQTAELEKLNGAAFDVAYLRQQLLEHQKTVLLLQWEMSQGQDAALQRQAMESLPVVLEHLQIAQAIFARLTGAGPQGLAASSPSPATKAETDRSRLRSAR